MSFYFCTYFVLPQPKRVMWTTKNPDLYLDSVGLVLHFFGFYGHWLHSFHQSMWYSTSMLAMPLQHPVVRDNRAQYFSKQDLLSLWTGLKSWLGLFPFYPWARYLTFWRHSFLFWKMNLIMNLHQSIIVSIKRKTLQYVR